MAAYKQLLVGVAVSLTLTILLLRNMNQRAQLEPLRAAEPPQATPQADNTEPERGATAATVKLRPPALQADPIDPSVPACPSIRLLEVEANSQTTTVWLADAAGTESITVGQKFRDRLVVAARGATEEADAVALLKGPDGTCRTATGLERLQAARDAIESRPPQLPEPAVARQLSTTLKTLSVPPSPSN